MKSIVRPEKNQHLTRGLEAPLENPDPLLITPVKTSRRRFFHGVAAAIVAAIIPAAAKAKPVASGPRWRIVMAAGHEPIHVGLGYKVIHKRFPATAPWPPVLSTVSFQPGEGS